jgi:hypothetical protein
MVKRRFAIVGEGSGGKPTPLIGKFYNDNRQRQSKAIYRSESVKESDCAAIVLPDATRKNLA